MGELRVRDDRWPMVISGTGGLVGLLLVGELIVFAIRPGDAHSGFNSGVITCVPFIVGIVYGGYWLARSDLSPDRYGRVGRWWIAGTIATTVVVLFINASMETMTIPLFLSTVRWSAAVGGGIGLAMGVLQTRTNQRALEAEQARRRERQTERERDRLEEFAGIVSHDLRNPLNVADGHLDLLREDCDSPHIEDISSAHDRMQEIVDDTFTLARAGTDVGETAPVELAEVAEACWQTVERADAALRVEGSTTVEADEDRLRHLFENLFRNAVEHSSTSPQSQVPGDAVEHSSTSSQASPDDAVEHGSTSSQASPEDAVEHGGANPMVRLGVVDGGRGFYVEDDGPGIPESERECVFESGYSGSGDGTGFGLSIVETVVDAHGWEITATESRDGGARFEVTGIRSVA